MGTYDLNGAEKILFDRIQHGDLADLTKEEERTIRAAVLRHFVLGLPVIKNEDGTWTADTATTQEKAPAPDDISCKVTGVGIAIKGGVIDDRLMLDGATGDAGGSVRSLTFEGTCFSGGFSGRHAKFLQLSFLNCTFRDPPDAVGKPSDSSSNTCSVARQAAAGAVTPALIPTIDLSDADIAGDLGLRGIHPLREGGEQRDHLWIRAVGLDVDGEIDLCCGRLRAPFPPSSALVCDEIEDALNLTLAKVRGDLRILGGTKIGGRIKLRAAQIHGDVWMDGATIEWATDDELSAFEAETGAPAECVEKESLIFLQGARIDGFLMMGCQKEMEGEEPLCFVCNGRLNITALAVGRSMHLTGARVKGDIVGPDLTVCLDLFLRTRVGGYVDLRDARIGGSLDIGELHFEDEGTEFSLKDATIGRTLQLFRPGAEEPDDDEEPASQGKEESPTAFWISGLVDLRGAQCDTLEDGAGTLWGRNARIRSNHFVYRQTGRLPRGRARKDRASHRVVADWCLAKRAESRGLWRLSRDTGRLRMGDYWREWQLRRNWIYQEFYRAKDDALTVLRHKVDEQDYRPQPFEQAIRVARAEGREDFAIQFEMLKQAIEWRLFNLQARSWLALAAISLASVWLLWNHGPGPGLWVDGRTYFWTWLALVVTVALIVWATTIRDGFCLLTGRDINRRGGWPRAVIWALYIAPASLLFLFVWAPRPFHFLVAFAIFMVIRSLGVVAHFVMRRGFGYLRRPLRAVITLIVVFLIGWWGVHIANQRNMLVVAAAPVATLTGPDENARFPSGYDAEGIPALFGNPGRRHGLSRELSCAATISEPLYALDVLIPIVDLGEESRCEVRRIADHETHRRIMHPKSMDVWEMGASIPDLPLNDHRFWWWMKALYAIAGWLIVSLALLTFAHANKTHAEPPEEKK